MRMEHSGAEWAGAAAALKYALAAKADGEEFRRRMRLVPAWVSDELRMYSPAFRRLVWSTWVRAGLETLKELAVRDPKAAEALMAVLETHPHVRSLVTK